MKRFMFSLCALALMAGVAHAEQIFIKKRVAAPTPPSVGMAHGEVVKNAPVHARLTTRSVRELCDGNRIVNEHTEVLYRDSAGRERREMHDGDNMVVFLRDGSGSTLLEPSHKIAVPMPDVPMPPVAPLAPLAPGVMVAPEIDVEIAADAPPAPAADGQREVKIVRKVVNSTSVVEDGGAMVWAGTVPGVPPHDFVELMGGPSGQTSVEPLGQKKIDGVRAEGTRHTTTFEAGALGNEKPIDVVKTTWYAPDLRMMLRSEESDPRAGTVTYTAEILSRDDPDAALFEVPEDYRTIGSEAGSGTDAKEG